MGKNTVHGGEVEFKSPAPYKSQYRGHEAWLSQKDRLWLQPRTCKGSLLDGAEGVGLAAIDVLA